jgi:Tfp pilus assembly protein PilN
MTLMDLNLLPSSAKFQASKIKLRKKVRTIIIWIIAGWLMVAAVITGMIVVVKIRTTATEGQYKKAQDAYLALKENIITSQRLKYRAKIVGGVLEKRFEYAKAFEAINSFFPPEIRLTSFKIKSQGVFQLLGETSFGQSLDKVEVLMADINNQKNDKFKTAKMTNLAYKNGSWVFTAEVELK